MCRLVRPVDNRIEVLVLQHPDEVNEAKGSARLLGLTLERCRIVVGERFDEADLGALLSGSGGGDTVLLFPLVEGRESADPVDSMRPDRIVLLDGTWRKCLKMWHLNPLLQRLPQWSIPPGERRRYGAFRKAKPNQLSTLEAACLALSRFEGEPAKYVPLMDSFAAFVAMAQAFMPQKRTSPPDLAVGGDAAGSKPPGRKR